MPRIKKYLGTLWLLLFFCTSMQMKADKKIYLLADIHVMAPSLLDSSDNAAWKRDLANQRKMQDLSIPIFDLLIAQIIADKPDLLLINGDLTKDGEYESHDYVINKLTKVKDAGIRIFVIPGNHDRGWMEEARVYAKDTFTIAESYTPEMFREAYRDFGYGEGSTIHESSLSYATELFPGLMLIGIDTGNMAQVSEEAINWACQKAKEARDNGQQVIVMAHHSLIPHIYGQEAVMIYSVIDTNEQLRDGLMAAGVKVVFTGHYHITDNTRYKNSEGQEIYDIATGSPISYPCDYRILTFDDKFKQLKITTKSITALDGYNDFPSYAKGRLQEAFLSWAYSWMKERTTHKGITSYLSKSIANVFIIHAEGNEPRNSASVDANALYDDMLFFAKFIEEEDVTSQVTEISLSMKSALGDYPSAEEQDNIVDDHELTIMMPTLPTGIHSIQNQDDKDAPWYNLQGLRLKGKPSKPGIYIHKGEKISL